MERKWSSLQDGQGGGREVVVLQWNLLSQSLGVHGDFAVCPTKALAWEHRRQGLVRELLDHGADILCLQEVDCFQHLASSLHPEGFAGIWVPKPNSPCLNYEVLSEIFI